MTVRKDGKHTGSPIIKARIKQRDKQSFEDLCAKQGLSTSECMRRALKQYVEANEEHRI